MPPTLPLYILRTLGTTLDHKSLFVPTPHPSSHHAGHIFHVTGTIQTGMVYESRFEENPEASVEFISKEQVGYIDADDVPKLRAICEAVPPPKKQFEGARRLESGVPLRRCGKWVEEVVECLRGEGILKG